MQSRYKYTQDIYAGHRLVVNPEVHALVKDYAKRNKIAMIEAVFNLLRAGFLALEGCDIMEVPARKKENHK